MLWEPKLPQSTILPTFLNPFLSLGHSRGMTVIDAMQKPDLEQLVCEHQAGVWRYLRYLGCAEAEADDLTQETFLAVIKTPPEIRSPSQTTAYLRTVARNRMLMARRRSGREIAVAQLDQAEQVWASSPASNGWGDYLDTLASGAKNFRICFTLR